MIVSRKLQSITARRTTSTSGSLTFSRLPCYPPWWTILLTVVWLFTATPVIAAALTIDFLLRATNYGRFSPINIVSGFLVKTFSIPVKPVDRAPKRFAAGVGSLFSFSILILSLFSYMLAAGVLTGILILFASLEALFAFCAGCYVYFFLKKLGV